jgi:hypothetical protein
MMTCWRAGLTMLAAGLAPEVIIIVGDCTALWPRIRPMLESQLIAKSITPHTPAWWRPWMAMPRACAVRPLLFCIECFSRKPASNSTTAAEPRIPPARQQPNPSRRGLEASAPALPR